MSTSVFSDDVNMFFYNQPITEMKCPVETTVPGDGTQYQRRQQGSDEFSDFMWMEDMENFDRQVHF